MNKTVIVYLELSFGNKMAAFNTVLFLGNTGNTVSYMSERVTSYIQLSYIFGKEMAVTDKLALV